MSPSHAAVLLTAALLLAPILAFPAASAPKPGKNLAACKAIYTRDCTMCHGATGKSSLPKVADFSSRQYRKAATDKKMSAVIANGAPGMQGYKKTLSAAQITDVVAYIRSMAH
jgi:mono/diheme cytochrome c family protein